MRDLAPDILRQRLLIEGFYRRELDAAAIREFLDSLARYLDLRSYGEAIVHSPGGQGKAANQGFDAFLPLIDSGIALYVWSARHFFALVLFTCKAFDVDRALAFTREHLRCEQLESRPF